MTNAPVSTGSVPKPVMRGLHNAIIKRNLAMAFLAVGTAAMVFKFTIKDPRKAAYAEFYKNYDSNKAFERMRKAGVFQSC